MANMRPGRINNLASLNNAKNYLEVGVCKGLTFTEVNIENKDAVDPYFAFDFESQRSSDVSFFEVPSDDFFSNFANTDKKYDVIYLDGLHEFNQTFRDFCNTLRFSHEKTIWLIDDTVPNSYFAGLPSQATARKGRDMVADKQNAWMGDVYKVIFAIHDYFPQFNIRTYKTHGQTVVWQSPNPQFKPVFNSLEAISRMDFIDFLEHKNSVFNFTTDDEILNDIQESLFGIVADEAA